MKNNKKIEKIYDEEKRFPIRKGYSLGTVFTFNPETPNNFELLNFGFSPSDNKFYLNKNVNLPKEIVTRIEAMPKNAQTKEFLLALGLYDYDDVYVLLAQYDKALENAELSKRKILNLKETLKKEGK